MAINQHEAITNTIIEALENGVVIWQKPWKTNKPCNAITGKPYRGINPFLLNLKGQAYADHRWLTFKQAQELGGTVKKGEKGTCIVFYSPVRKEDEDGKQKNFFLLRSYYVFNVEQCENLDKLPALEVQNTDVDPMDKAEAIWNMYADAPKVVNGQNAYYTPSLDIITMPAKDTFIGNAEYYATLFHEGAHSTGHESRLSRKGITEMNGFGTELYSQEELIAEFAASFLCGEAGIQTNVHNNSVAYIQGWIKVFKNDKTILMKAASQAQKVADYMMGVGEKVEESTEELVSA